MRGRLIFLPRLSWCVKQITHHATTRDRWQREDLLPARIPITVRHAIFNLPLKWHRRVLLAKALAGEEIPEHMLTPIDYAYHPASYWDAQNLQHVVSNIKGAERKKQALRLIEEERLDQANEFILADTLSEEERTLTGKIHPALMGGEYLPDYNAGEVEIARVTLASVTQDVISVRAFPKSEGVCYRVVDEYNSVCEILPEFSQSPLAFRKLLHLIDTVNR